MLRQLQNHAVRIVIGVAFFIFGFFVVANTLELTEREIVIGLVGGAIGGITMLVAVIRDERKLNYSASPSAS